MKPFRRPLMLASFVMASAMLFVFSPQASAQNIISGTIYDKARNPLPDIDIELLDEYHRMVRNGRQKTSSTGRYEFGGLNNGRYYVRVFAFRYDLIDEEREVVISSVSAIAGQPGTSFNLEDFYLQPRRGGLRDTELSVIFAQAVPKEAEQVYKQALDDLAKRRSDEGFAGLQKAIEIFPSYYEALQRLGSELFQRKQYLNAAQAYLKASDVNPKSAMPLYNAAYALYMLGSEYYKAAKTVLLEAVKLAPASPPVNLLLGTIEHKTGDLLSAEKHLIQAKKSAQNKIAEIHKELAQVYDEQKKYGQAADELESYIKASKMSDEDEAKVRKIVSGLRAKAGNPSGT